MWADPGADPAPPPHDSVPAPSDGEPHPGDAGGSSSDEMHGGGGEEDGLSERRVLRPRIRRRQPECLLPVRAMRSVNNIILSVFICLFIGWLVGLVEGWVH